MPWSARIHTGFHVSRATLELPRPDQVFKYGTITPYGCFFQSILLTLSVPYWSPNPHEINLTGLGCSAFARHYLRNRFRFLFLRLLRCFNSAGSLHMPMCSACDLQVSPFGNPRIKVYVPLPEAYRSLSRPSSPGVAKAFTNCPYQFGLFHKS
jgi:hypothetical protein